LTYVLLTLDCETTGIIPRGMSPQHPDHPRLVQLGLALIDADGRERATVELTVVQERPIPEDAARVHGITAGLAAATGVPVRGALLCYTHLRRLAAEVVAHNAPFDLAVLAAEFARIAGTEYDCHRRLRSR
jgi:DNA polymerase III epsilon subunit-like protein